MAAKRRNWPQRPFWGLIWAYVYLFVFSSPNSVFSDFTMYFLVLFFDSACFLTETRKNTEIDNLMKMAFRYKKTAQREDTVKLIEIVEKEPSGRILWI